MGILLCSVCGGKAAAGSMLYASGHNVLSWGPTRGVGQAAKGRGDEGRAVKHVQMHHGAYVHALTQGKRMINQFSRTLSQVKQTKLLPCCLSRSAGGNRGNAARGVEPPLPRQAAEPLVSLLFAKAWS